jgi:hypothetical protein
MKNIAENNLIRFVNITKKKDGLFANFRAKGIKGGTKYSSSISISLQDAEVDLTESLESIIEKSARIAVKEYKSADVQFEGLQSI